MGKMKNIAESRADSVNRAKNSLDSAISKQEVNSSIFDEKSGLCSCERENRTNGSLTKRATNLPDLSQKDAEFATFFTIFFNFIGEDSTREGLLKTPARVMQSWEKLYGGYKKDPLDLLSATQYSENYDEMVVLKDIKFYSMCEHHILPFFGSVNIGYIPNKKVVGISHLVELVEIFARRLQIQERLNEQITQSIWSALNPKGVMVTIKATHLCMAMQGKENATIITSSVRGTFKKDARSRAEFMAHIR